MPLAMLTLPAVRTALSSAPAVNVQPMALDFWCRWRRDHDDFCCSRCSRHEGILVMSSWSFFLNEFVDSRVVASVIEQPCHAF